MGLFGSSLPPGCGTLPGEEPENWGNFISKEAFPDYAGPYEMYRALYEYTACGPGLGVTVLFPEGQKDTFFCDSLRKLGTWDDMDKRGETIVRYEVNSIVEGVDQCPDSIEVEVDPEGDPDKLCEQLYAAVDEVNKQAKEIWDATHGCPTCARHWAEKGGNHIPEDADSDDYWPVGETPVWADCPECEGVGTVI